ncbi:MAG: MotA/TolQ/ExbB proton channel family protein [Thermoguttaceae bacterium]|nr:MotA/TolQ/ExbB proton channel family protein [Thermoguttaceae bacterium]
MDYEVNVPLSWSRSDIEQRLGVRGARFTRVRHSVALLAGILLTILFYAAMIPLGDRYYWVIMFTERGPTQHVTVLFTSWAIVVLWVKWQKLVFQRKALNYSILPEDPDFMLSSTTVEQVSQRMLQLVDDPKHFLLYHRILIALSNLQNLGRVGDVEEILRSQASQDESSMETSYSILQGLIWAIPVLGFIGTVLGLSEAIGQFGTLLQSAGEISEVKDGLQLVTSGLSTAFETTLVALVAALGIQLWLVSLKKAEEEFLDECSEYCIRNVVGRLRVNLAEQSLFI